MRPRAPARGRAHLPDDAREWGRERLLRDAQVLPIWEDASNVLALDVLRAPSGRDDAHEPLLAEMRRRPNAASHPALAARKALVARRFVDRRLRDRDARGITTGDRLPDEEFDAIVRFAPVAPGDVAEGVAADD